MVLPCHWSQRATVAADLVRCYGALGRTIIFCDTKKDCNELVASLGEGMRAQPLHGDIPQQQREVNSAHPTIHSAQGVPEKMKNILGRGYCTGGTKDYGE